MPVPLAHILRFGVFELDRGRGELRKYGLKIHISRQALKLLEALLHSPGQLLSREELSRRIGLGDGETFVDSERCLNKAVYKLRQVLGDSAFSPRYLETVASQGYRFMPFPESGDLTTGARGPSSLESIAIMPMDCESAEPNLGFFTSQVVSQLINKLANTSHLRVLAYNTVKHLQSSNSDPRILGHNLGVE